MLDITLEQSSRESVADAAVVVEPISMIYTWLAGARLDWNFLVKTSSISVAAQKLRYIKRVYILLSSQYFHKQF